MILESNNPIAHQSKSMLLTALLELMDAYPYQKISITAITEHAQLSRRTFYRNFESKEDILRYHFDILGEAYANRLMMIQPLTYPKIVHFFVSFWNEQLHLLTVLKKNQLYHLLLEHLNQIGPDIYKKTKKDWQEYDSDDDMIYAMTFSIGGLWNVIGRWIDEGKALSPDNMERVIKRSIKNNQSS